MENDQFPFQEQYAWEKRELIGQGAFAAVYKVKERKSGLDFAVKQLDMSKFDEQFKMDALRTEIQAMKQCDSPYVVKMYDYKIGKIYTYLVLQLCDENLKEFMDKKLMLNEAEALAVFCDITAGYKALIDKQYVHRDIKPKNILRKDKTFKITDFGFARKYKYDSEKLSEFCGTPLYMAPQLLYQKVYTDKCDIWSFGLILFEILFGYSPFTTRYSQIYKREVVTRDVNFPYGVKIGESTKEFIQKCLQLEEENRFSWKQLLNHPFLKYKNVGKPLEIPQIDVKYQHILGRIQNSSFSKFINAKWLFNKYENNEGIGEERFYRFLMDLDPQITTYESKQIFTITDTSKDGKIHINEFKKLYTEIDFRSPKDTTSRLIEQIARIAQAKNLTVKEFFNMFDTNKSKQIDFVEFSDSIRKIVPRLESREIQLLWAKIDKDKSRLVDLKEFMDAVTRVMTPFEKVDFKNYERAMRNIDYLRGFLKQKNVTSQQIFNRKKGDNTRMTFDEFGGLVRSIKYQITRDEAVEMFRLIDSDHSESIDVQELHKILNQSETTK